MREVLPKKRVQSGQHLSGHHRPNQATTTDILHLKETRVERHLHGRSHKKNNPEIPHRSSKAPYYCQLSDSVVKAQHPLGSHYSQKQNLVMHRPRRSAPSPEKCLKAAYQTREEEIDIFSISVSPAQVTTSHFDTSSRHPTYPNTDPSQDPPP